MKVNKPTAIKVEFDENDVNCIGNALRMVDSIVNVINDKDVYGLYDNHEDVYFSLKRLQELNDELFSLYTMLELRELEIK